MKYLKTFEALSDSNYQKGDYVLLDIDKILSNNIDYEYVDDDGGINPYQEYALISEEPIELNDGIFLYSVIFHDYNEEKDNSYGIESTEIIRKLTPFEIEFFNKQKEASKYNI